MKKADQEIETVAKVDVAAYLGHNLDFASARLGDYVTKAMPHLLADPEIVKTFNKWGVSSVEKGKINQLLEHLFNQAYNVRMEKIEKIMDLNPGSITDAFTKKDLHSIKNGIKTLDNTVQKIKENSEIYEKLFETAEGSWTKRNYFKPPLPGSVDKEGVRVIETNKITNTIFPCKIDYFTRKMKEEKFEKIK